jgi:hypothetical protein
MLPPISDSTDIETDAATSCGSYPIMVGFDLESIPKDDDAIDGTVIANPKASRTAQIDDTLRM